MKRAEKIALLQALLTGNATSQQIEHLRKNKEPICVTLLLDEDTINVQPDDPQYCINVYTDGKTRRFDRYADGREVDRL